jgi:hypothetical protein
VGSGTISGSTGIIILEFVHQLLVASSSIALISASNRACSSAFAFSSAKILSASRIFAKR